MTRKSPIIRIYVIISLLILTGCKKEDKEIYNIISLEGNSITEFNQNYIPVSGTYMPATLWECDETMYRTDIQIVMDPSSALILQIYNTTMAGSIPEGNFSVAPACEVGFNASFYPTTGRKAQGIAFSAGSMTVEKDGEDYFVDVNLTIDTESGGGTLIGNFKGPLTTSPEK